MRSSSVTTCVFSSLLLASALLSTSGGCDGSSGTTGGGGTTTTATTGGSAGEGGGAPTCETAGCAGPGEVCEAGQCVQDCRKPGATPCADDTSCDASDAGPGLCVGLGSPCLTTSAPEPCGDRVCGPGSLCNGNGQCYPRVPCKSVNCNDDGCWGTQCACVRSIGCSPAPLGAPGEAGTLHDDAFRAGLVDLEFDPTCTAWGVTLISGPDYLRSISPEGEVSSYPGVTNLNMGEVSVLQDIVIPKSGHGSGPAPAPVPPGARTAPVPSLPDVRSAPPPPEDLEVAMTYICCSSCGCQLQSTPQGVSHFDPMTGMLPLVIPSQTFTTGNGPFGAAVIDTGPAGLTYGTDRVLYVGNVDVNGDYHRLDLATDQKTVVTTFASRVHASAAYDAIRNLVALESGEIHLLRLPDASSEVWAVSDSPVTGLVRDTFDGSVYVARADAAVWRYDEYGQGAPFMTAQSRSRLAIAPDGYLYAIHIPAAVADATPTFERWELPKTR